MNSSQVVVITGGSAGIGRAAALAFVRRGNRVAILARDPVRLEAACAELRAAGGTVLGISVDVADAAQVEQAAERIERELGPISVWVNNVSTTVFAPVLETTPAEFKRVINVAFGLWLMAAPWLLAGAGRFAAWAGVLACWRARS